MRNYLQEIITPTPTLKRLLDEYNYLFVEDFGSWEKETDNDDDWEDK